MVVHPERKDLRLKEGLTTERSSIEEASKSVKIVRAASGMQEASN